MLKIFPGTGECFWASLASVELSADKMGESMSIEVMAT